MALDDLLAAARGYEQHSHDPELASAPARELAVLACMDARIDLYRLLGLEVGDAHIIRNAGGLASDDAIRSLSLSQYLLGTREILVVQHTRCGMMATTDEEFAAWLPEPPPWRPGAFEDLEESVRAAVRTLAESPFLPHRDAIAGCIFDVDTGRLSVVEPA